MHPVAAEGFRRAAGAYQRGRPDYPADAVTWLVDALAVRPGVTIVDVGAGTGKFTAQLVPTGATVVAVEPVDEMRALLSERLPTVRALAGRAEDLPLETGSADAIVAAQAFHWFAMPAAADEFHRVLRTGGRVGLIWNERDTRVDWVRQLENLIEPMRATAPHARDTRSASLGERFSAPIQATFSHVQWLDAGQLRDRIASVSYVAILDQLARDELLARVEDLAATHPDLAGHDRFALPYVTTAAWMARL